MIRVLFFIPTLGHGGAEKVLVNLVNNMDRSQFDITVQTLFDQGVNKQYLSPEISYRSFLKKQFRGNTTLFSFLPAKWLYRLIVREKYDVVVSYLEGPTTRIIAGCPYPETKKVAWVHIELNNERLLKMGFKTVKEAKRAYHALSKIICVSNTVKDVFESTAKEFFPNMTVLYNTNETEIIKEKSSETVDDVAFSQDVPNMISVAKLMSTKGFDRLVRIHKRLLDEGIRQNVYILGVGEKKAELEDYIMKNHLSDSFYLLGYRDNPYKYVAKADLYVCSSRREGFSTAVTEALVVGTPVVSTNCSGAYELLGENNEYGIVTENDEEALYQGIYRMLTEEGLLQFYQEKAAERGEAFDTIRTVAAVEDMLRSL